MSMYNINIDQVIARSLNGEISHNDKVLLEIWLSDSANRKEYEEIVKLWTISEEVAQFHQFDKNTAWIHLTKRFDLRGSESKVISINRYKLVAIAAIFILVVGGFWLIYSNNNLHLKWQAINALTNQEIVLKDGSHIALRKGSTLRYPDNFGIKNRRLELKGEAYFDVKHDAQNVFQIKTPKGIISDLGTSFLIINNDSIDKVFVIEGKVSLQSQNDETKVITLEAGMKGELKANQLFKENVGASVNNYLAWQTGTLKFENTPLYIVLEEISDYYQLNLHLSLTSNDNQKPINAEFKNQSLDQVIEELELFTGLKIKKEGSILYIWH
ncbi:MAG: FecR family protein [Flavisolibacter sp.]